MAKFTCFNVAPAGRTGQTFTAFSIKFNNGSQGGLQYDLTQAIQDATLHGVMPPNAAGEIKSGQPDQVVSFTLKGSNSTLQEGSYQLLQLQLRYGSAFPLDVRFWSGTDAGGTYQYIDVTDNQNFWQVTTSGNDFIVVEGQHGNGATVRIDGGGQPATTDNIWVHLQEV